MFYSNRYMTEHMALFILSVNYMRVEDKFFSHAYQFIKEIEAFFLGDKGTVIKQLSLV